MINPDSIRAALTALVLRDNDASFEVIEEALLWLDSAPGNEAELARVERFLQVCDQASLALPPPPEPEVLPQRWWSVSGRKLGAFAVLPAIVALIGLAAWPLFRPGPPKNVVAINYYSTDVGEIRQVRLNDGSEITLGGASELSVSIDKSGRRVKLAKGEAMFEVARDPRRPFTVDAGQGVSTAIGTGFVVNRAPLDTTVTVLHGTVQIISEGSDLRSRAILKKTMQVSYTNNGAMTPIRRVDLDEATSWTEGQLSFVERSLPDVVSDLTRYSMAPIRIEGPGLEQVRVTGTVRADGVIEWLKGLCSVTGLEMIRTPHSVIVRARQDDGARI